MNNLGFDTLLLATHNQGKVAEFQDMLGEFGITLKSANDFNLPEPEETGKIFTENALLKARAAAAKVDIPCLSDDSGLAIDALNGEPGIHSARWAETINGRDFTHAMNKVNEKIGGIKGNETAYFIAVLALVFPDGREEIFEGRINGSLCWPPRGTKGFGYDPIFVPDNHIRSFGEFEPDEKHAISHRANAVERLKSYLRNYGQ